MKRIGVLALQGAFAAHRAALARAGADAVEVRRANELADIDGLVIPGGESTTMLLLLAAEGLLDPLRQFGESKPIFGTCAGAVLLAREVSNPAQPSLGLVDISIERNAYGRQVASRVAPVTLAESLLNGNGSSDMEAVFIRAPIIRRTGVGATALAFYHGDPVLVEQGRHLVATFHPELTADQRVHRLFLSKVSE